ncbi:hypothetical protein WJX84_002252 [Apatococcus fuscideae]|uniref:Methyltransferase FkbM domain-containing protein n=1 Tax=Apatococcus fuscideae TaxID=2026836 RepID=A0AAW1TBQ5_9CHLO
MTTKASNCLLRYSKVPQIIPGVARRSTARLLPERAEASLHGSGAAGKTTQVCCGRSESKIPRKARTGRERPSQQLPNLEEARLLLVLSLPPFGPPQTARGADSNDLEDEYAVDFFFYNKKHGTYLEMGGYDGLTFTNTLYLNKALGWRGMLIEASPQQYYRMIGNRKDDIGLLVAACDTYKDVHFVDTGTSGGILEFMSEAFKSTWHKDLAHEDMVDIPCMPLSSILSKFGVHQLDFWSLDVEGGEFQVLQTFDFDAVRINVICLEADGHAPEKDKAVVDFLKSKGYQYYGHIDRNDWFTHPDFKPSKKLPGVVAHHPETHHKPEARAAMQTWFPGWWSSELSHWQEFPAEPEDPGAPFHGQDYEDQYAADYLFSNKMHGTYLEMGGFDGLTYTNTLHLAQALGWRGMLIEASPANYAKMIGNRKNDIGVHVAACETHQDVHFVDHGTTTGGIFEFMSDSFRDQWHKGIDINALTVIPCMPLHDILAKFGVTSINFWSLDVEGGELQVLQTFDFSTVHVDVIVLEADGHSWDKDQAPVTRMTLIDCIDMARGRCASF